MILCLGPHLLTILFSQVWVQLLACIQVFVVADIAANLTAVLNVCINVVAQVQVYV